MIIDYLVSMMLTPDQTTTKTTTACEGRRIVYENSVISGPKRPALGTLWASSLLKIDGQTIFDLKSYEGILQDAPSAPTLSFKHLSSDPIQYEGAARILKYQTLLTVGNVESSVTEPLTCIETMVEL